MLHTSELFTLYESIITLEIQNTSYIRELLNCVRLGEHFTDPQKVVNLHFEIDCNRAEIRLLRDQAKHLRYRVPLGWKA